MHGLHRRWAWGRRVRPGDAGGYTATLAGVTALTLLLTPLRDRLTLLNIGLFFLVLAVVIAARWGWGPGMVASVAAYLAFDFFFFPPRGRLLTGEPSDLLALLVFLGVTALTSALLARARAGEQAAQRREHETETLYELSRLIIVESDLSVILTAMCDRARETFGAQSCAVLAAERDGLPPLATSGAMDGGRGTAGEYQAAQRAMAEGVVVAYAPPLGRRGGSEGDRGVPVTFVPLLTGGRAMGVLRVAGDLDPRATTDDGRRLLEAFADEAALAVDRARLLQEAARTGALLEADRLRSALLSAVSHDLRTPLASIKASSSSLLQPDVEWDEDSRRQFLTAIDEETDRLTRLVSNLLDLSRIEGGALRPDKDWYDVRELVETAVNRLGRLTARHVLELDVAPDVGAAPLDYVQIAQVLTNLIENAVKFAPERTVIRVTARRAGDAVEIAVADQGPGIPPEERGRVFQKFYRGAGTGMRAPGTGLGLAISHGLVEAHGGQIGVEDAPGGGARVVVTLPAPAATVVGVLSDAR